MTKEQLAAIQARCEAAAPGLWRAMISRIPNKYYIEGNRHCYTGQPEWDIVAEVVHLEADAEFIAHSKADITALLAGVAERDKEIDRLSQLAMMREGEIGDRDREIDLVKQMYAKVCEDKCTSDAEVERLREIEKEVEILNSRVDAQMRLFERAWRWIPVTERLPKPKSYVLITDCFGAVRECYYAKAFITRFRTEIKATHWMPLPQPPTGEDN